MNDSPDANASAQRKLHEQASLWLLRLEEDDFGEPERTELARWLAEDESHNRALEEMAALWGQLDTVAHYHQSRQQASRSKIASQPSPVVRRSYISLAAAAIIVLCVLAYPTVALRLQADYMTAAGQSRQITLADGTRVDLSTDSALRVSYTEGLREVTLLQGEAYFQVHPNKQRPFSVVAGTARATAVGTAYLVRHGNKEGAVIVTEGRVEVEQHSDDNSTDAVEVSAGQSVDFTESALSNVVQRTDLDSATAWLRGKLIFDGERLERVVAELNRYHTGRIVMVGDAFKRRRVTGVFSTKDPVHIVQAIATGLNLRVTRLTDYLILLHSS